MENGKRAVGKLVNLMLEVAGDFAEVVARLRRPGVPSRIDPCFYVKRNPAMVDWDMRGAIV